MPNSPPKKAVFQEKAQPENNNPSYIWLPSATQFLWGTVIGLCIFLSTDWFNKIDTHFYKIESQMEVIQRNQNDSSNRLTRMETIIQLLIPKK